MAALTEVVTQVPILAPSKDYCTINSTNATLEKINSITDLIAYQAQNIPDVVLIAYPYPDDSISDFADFTAKELDHYADQVAKELSRQGLRPSQAKTEKAEVVGLLGLSNLDYILAILALSRMGFTVLFLSTRLPTEAYVSLLRETNCTTLVTAPRFTDSVTSIQGSYSAQNFRLPDQSTWARATSTSPFERQVELVNEEDTIAFIVHSSGSTGLPKPIYQTHRQCLGNYAVGNGMRAFVTLPLFHNHGLSTMFRGIAAGKCTMIYNANLPLTNKNLVVAMSSASFESFHCVPYALKVLAETNDGVEQLAKATLVLFGGSSCPDELGDMLVERGVNLVSHYGATEMGQLMTSLRDPEKDKAWNYVRPLAKVRPFLFFDETSPGIFELVVLDGLPTKTIANSDNPPNSYRTRDTFVKHPSMSDAWKYLGRLDDRITLFNGEKVLPVPYEHRIRKHDMVQDCLMFGVGRAFPGLFVFPSAHANDKTAEEVLDIVWPTIQEANENAEKFGRVSREMVKVMPVGTDYPRTDKGTIIRAASYQHFKDVIEDVYRQLETAHSDHRLTLDIPQLREYLLKLLSDRIGVQGLDLERDFFVAGMDSLQAITARAYLLRELDLGNQDMGQQVVFEYPSVSQLAEYLFSLRLGSLRQEKSEEKLMEELVDKYTMDFKPFKGGSKVPDGEVILLTGATGSLGAHILNRLIHLPHIRHVYCLIRASSPENAQERVFNSLVTRDLTPHHGPSHNQIISSLLNQGLSPYHHTAKFTALPADLSLPDLGLGEDIHSALRETVTSVIHSAWAVNFTLNVRSFETQHIAGVRHLLDLCLSVPFTRPARFQFISSISAAAGTPTPASISEAQVNSPSHAQNMGYARSKWVAEHIVCAAAASTGIEARVLRSGQIIGDSMNGLWNPSEAIPLMIQSAQTLGVLPALDENPSWLPVDQCAQAVLELGGLATSGRQIAGYFQVKDEPGIVFHLVNPKTASWNEDILPALAAAGLKFDILGQREWVKRLRDGEQDPRKNPTVKLLDFFTDKYDNDRPGRSGLVFETQKTAERSKTIARGYDVVASGLISRCVAVWMREWAKE